MRRKLFGMFVLAATLSACAPNRIEYEHLVLQDVPELEVLDRSKPQKTPPVEKIRHAKYGLPVLARLKRERYTLTIETPANSSYPMLFVGARTPTGEKLQIEGQHVKSVHPDALVINKDHPYTFMTREADGAPLEIVIRDVHGKQVGTEKLDYEIVVTGVIWGIESI